MKLIFSTIALFFNLHFVILSQVSTVDETWWGTTGKLTATTTILDGARIYNGPYSYLGYFPPSDVSRGTLSIKTNKKNGVLDGLFSLSYLGGHSTGELDFKLSGMIKSNNMTGVWNIKSKCYNKYAVDDESYTWNKSYTMTLNELGQITAITMSNIQYGEESKIQTDSEGYMHGKITYKYKDEDGYLVVQTNEYCHGINVSNYLIDVQTGKLLGTKEQLQDPLIVNDKNYNKEDKLFLYNGIKYKLTGELEYCQHLFSEDNEIGNIWSCLSDNGNCNSCLPNYILPRGWKGVVIQN
jgi:hypothetical protein